MFQPTLRRPISTQMFLRWGRRQKAVVICFVCLGIFMYYHIFVKYFLKSQLFTSHLEDPRFNGADMCPACLGTTLCGDIGKGQVEFVSFSRVRMFDLVNIKNVYQAKYRGRDVVLKRLGHNSEWKEADDAICESAGFGEDCKVSTAVYKSQHTKLNRQDGLSVEIVRGLSDIVRCPSQRLLDKIWSAHKKSLGHSTGPVSLENKMMFMLTLSFNPEPILAQTFPASEGWPFPSYLGACGRFVIMEDIGESLLSYLEASWSVRVDLSYQVFAMAHQLSNNEEDYALYMTDVIFDNFAVSEGGQVRLIDLENVIVVDKKKIREEHPPYWDEKLQSYHDECPDSPNCLSFSPNDLCTHLEADHNYYAVCHGLLGSDATVRGVPSGLLLDIPDSVKEKVELQNLVNECQNPAVENGRFIVAPQLLSLLQRLSNRI